MRKPWVIVNCAMSIDGKIALPSREQTRISNEKDIRRVHQLRNNCDAILVGIGTILSDDPKLLVKKKYIDKGEVHQPLRIVLDSRFRIPGNAQVLQGTTPTLVVTTSEEKHKKNVEIIKCGRNNERVDINKLMTYLSDRGIDRLLVEGGETVIWEFIKLGLVNELLVFIAPMVIGGISSPSMAGGNGAQTFNDIVFFDLVSYRKIGEGILLQYVPMTTIHSLNSR